MHQMYVHGWGLIVFCYDKVLTNFTYIVKYLYIKSIAMGPRDAPHWIK